MGLPDQLRMLSSLVNVELAHGGSHEPLPSSRSAGEEGRGEPGNVLVMRRTEVCVAWALPFSKTSFMLDRKNYFNVVFFLTVAL